MISIIDCFTCGGASLAPSHLDLYLYFPRRSYSWASFWWLKCSGSWTSRKFSVAFVPVQFSPQVILLLVLGSHQSFFNTSLLLLLRLASDYWVPLLQERHVFWSPLILTVLVDSGPRPDARQAFWCCSENHLTSCQFHIRKPHNQDLT